MIVIQNARVRKSLRFLLPFAIIPGLVVLGAVFAEKQHLVLSFCVAVMAVLLFIAGFERRQTGARRMVIAAVMTALCIVGRFIPFFKPITALTVITAIYLGGETGFLVGALAAVLSNFYFGQGLWTPFQMLAWGLIGLAAGYIGPVLKKSRAMLLVYGVLSGIVYSFVMDVWTVLWYSNAFQWQLYASALVTAIPHTVLYSASNFLFLWFLARPIGEKMDRIRIKYGV